MSQINTNINSLIAQRVLKVNNSALTKSLERLSTGYRINRGGDDPAGLIISEQLRAEKKAISSAIANAERAGQIVNIAESGLQEVTNLITELQGLVGQVANDAGISDEEKEAVQLQVDQILSSIDRIASTTEFNGTKLLNGRLDFLVSGVNNAQIENFEVNGAKIPTDANIDVQLVITQSAQHAGLFLSAGAAQLDLGGATSAFEFELTGTEGSRVFTFASGTALTDIATSINGFKDITGVSAAVSGTGIVLKTDEFGSDQFISLKITDDGGQAAGGIYLLSAVDEAGANTGSAVAFTAAAAANGVRDEGQDIGGSINGLKAAGNGKTLTIRNEALDIKLNVAEAEVQTLQAITAGTIYGGGAKFNIGPEVTIGNEVAIGIRNIASRNLGNSVVGHLSDLGSGQDNDMLTGDLNGAQQIINEAINQVTGIRGRLGSFQKNVVGSSITALNISYENISAAESSIRDTDFAKETSELTRSQILVAAASQALQISNSSPQNVLTLLG